MISRSTALLPMRPRIPVDANAGFSLLEVMVGLLVASLSTVMILQVFLLFDAQKRAVMSGDDAQSTGAIGFYSLQRDVRRGGYGINAFDLIGCDVTLPSGLTLAAMAPVTINHASIPAGDPHTDTLMVVYGNNRGGPGGSIIGEQDDPKAYPLDSALSFAEDDYVIAEPLQPQPRPSPCSLTLDAVDENPDPTTPTTVKVKTGAAYPGGRLYNLGSAPRILVYAIRGGNLTVCDYLASDCGGGDASDATIWKPIANNIVSLRAEYGRDTSPMDPTQDPTVDVWDQTTPASNCGWVRTSAVRLVMVARSGQPVPGNDATADNPDWAGNADAAIDLSETNVRSGFDWHKYRYKVFETTIPIRNITLMGAQPGC